LFNIAKDPGETQDLQLELPELFLSMQADYAKWAKANGVLEMPSNYDPIQQVIINSLVFVYWPRYKLHLIGILGLLLLGTFWLWRRRKNSALSQPAH
jgi:arylsulfatase/uncharacterized sulfatase